MFSTSCLGTIMCAVCSQSDCSCCPQVRFAILDEADQMLDMGFQDDMEEILSKSPPERQTLLFSATLPTWVHKVAKKYLRDPLVVDLVGEENTGKLADTIRLMVMQVMVGCIRGEGVGEAGAVADARVMFGIVCRCMQWECGGCSGTQAAAVETKAV